MIGWCSRIRNGFLTDANASSSIIWVWEPVVEEGDSLFSFFLTTYRPLGRQDLLWSREQIVQRRTKRSEKQINTSERARGPTDRGSPHLFPLPGLPSSGKWYAFLPSACLRRRFYIWGPVLTQWLQAMRLAVRFTRAPASSGRGCWWSLPHAALRL